MKKRVLIVEDGSAITGILRDNLDYEEFTVDIYEAFSVEKSQTCAEAQSLLKYLPQEGEAQDLASLHGSDEPKVFPSTQQQTLRGPIIILSARGGTKKEFLGGLLEGGSDETGQGFALDELLSRIHAALRGPRSRPDKLRLGEVIIDFRQLRAVRRNRDIELTDREFEILRILANRRGGVVSRDELLHSVWGYPDAPLTRTVDNFILRLRRKLEPDPRHPTYIRTAYGDGYRLVCN